MGRRVRQARLKLSRAAPAKKLHNTCARARCRHTPSARPSAPSTPNPPHVALRSSCSARSVAARTVRIRVCARSSCGDSSSLLPVLTGREREPSAMMEAGAGGEKEGARVTICLS